jgi:hypothetical protein
LQALLRYVFADQQFFDFDVEKVRAAIIAKEGSVTEATSTIIRVKTADRDKEIKFPLLEFYARQYPQLKALQQLHQIEIKLNLLRTETLVGGKKELARGIKLANQELKKQFPKDAPILTEKDITGAGLSPDGEPYVYLFWATNGYDLPYFNATLEWPAKDMPTVKVDGNLK